jgi:hypothetical protein
MLCCSGALSLSSNTNYLQLSSLLPLWPLTLAGPQLIPYKDSQASISFGSLDSVNECVGQILIISIPTGICMLTYLTVPE